MPVIPASETSECTVADVVARVKKQYGDETEREVTREDILRWMNDACIDVVRKTKCLQAERLITVAPDQDNYALPLDYLFSVKVTYEGYKLQLTSMEQFDTDHPNRDSGDNSGTPKYAWKWGTRLYLWPTPAVAASASDKLKLYYIRRPAKLDNDGQLLDLPPGFCEDVVRYCVSRAKEHDEEMVDAERIMADYDHRVDVSRQEMQNPNQDSYPAIRLLPGDF